MSFAIGIVNTKNCLNIGTLMRSALNLGASMVFTVGRRYKKECSDTQNTFKQIPLIHFENWQDFLEHCPHAWIPVAVEICEGAVDIKDFKHPKEAIYILGAEDHGLPKEALKIKNKIYIPTNRCMNVAVTGSIVMYDRMIKLSVK